MSTTITQMVTMVRYRLDEATARKWSDNGQIIPYVSQAERRVAGIISRIPKSRRFRVTHESITLAANATTFDLTTLAKAFDWLISVSVVVANVEIQCWTFEEGEQANLRNLILGGGLPVSRIDLQDENLVVLPSYGSARTFYVSYGWIPALKTSGNLETPVKYDDLVRDWAAWYANADAGIVNDEQQKQLMVRESEIEDLERSRRGISNESVVQRSGFFARCQ